MSAREYETDLQRLLVALDSTADSLETLEIAAELAARLNAELMGLFVEDRRLMQLAELSCAREVRFASARAKPMRATTIGRHLRAQEAAAQRALASAAGGRRVSWSFRVTRGQITSVLTEESPEVGLVFVSRTAGRPERHLYRPRISEEGGRPRRRIAHTETPVVIAYDRSALSDRALEVAGRIARAAPVTVLVPAQDAVEASTAARHRLANRPVPDHVMPVAAGDFASLRTAIGIAGSDLLVLPCDSRLLGERSVDDLVDVLRVPVVLVRQEA